MIADERPWADPEVRALIDAAPIGYVAVATNRGPHVTPQLVTSAAGRLWFVTSETSVKARAVRRRPGVALTAWAPEATTAVVIHGDGHVLDAFRPVELGRHGVEAMLGAVGLAKYAVDHAAETLQSMWDIAAGHLANGGDRRVLVGVQPDRVEVISVSPRSDAVLSWLTPKGVLAVPGTWDESAGRFGLSRPARQLVEGRRSSPAAVSVDRSTGIGAADRAGAMFRGRGRLARGVVTMSVERHTTWADGAVTTTSHVEGSGVEYGRPADDCTHEAKP